MAKKTNKKKINYKSNSKWFWIFLIIVVILGYNAGWFGSMQSIVNVDVTIPDIGDVPFDDAPIDKDCSLELDDYDICYGDSTTGTTQNGELTHCYLFAKRIGETYEPVYEGDTDINGVWKETQTINAVGTFYLRTLCDEDGNGAYTPVVDCISNEVELKIVDCDSDSDSDSDTDDTVYTCGWTGSQCGGTCPSTYPDCVDIEYEPQTLFFNEGYTFCGCINDEGEVAPDWKPDGDNHEAIPEPEPEPDYYDMSSATYWVRYDSLTGGSPLRMEGKFGNEGGEGWDFVTSSSTSGSEQYATLTVTFKGSSVSIPLNGYMELNLDDFMGSFDGQSGDITFESKFSSGYVRMRSIYTGTVDMS